MQFRDDEYYRASLERIRQAETLYLQGDAYALAIYSGGLAVECLLRAFRWKEDSGFDGRHDLSELLRASKVFRVDEDFMRRRKANEEEILESTISIRTAMNEVIILWHNNLRFASEKRLRDHLVRLNRVQGVKGDPLKKNARDSIDAAWQVINRGIVLWDSQKK